MNEQREMILKAIECCRRGHCENCPLQRDICDDLMVDTEVIPTELLDMIEEELK